MGFTTLDFQMNGHLFTQQFIFCHRQSRPLILGQDFCIHYHTSCDRSQPPFKMLKLRGKVIIQIEEPEADKYISVRKSLKIPPRHYAVTPHLVAQKPQMDRLPSNLMRYLGVKTPLLGWTPFTWTQTVTWSPCQVRRPLTHR